MAVAKANPRPPSRTTAVPRSRLRLVQLEAERRAKLATHTIEPRPPVEMSVLEAWNYAVDSWKSGILFFETLRRRATNMLEHEPSSPPPLLGFNYEPILGARHFEQLANFALLRITEIAGKLRGKARHGRWEE